jgi:hypothetical protein
VPGDLPRVPERRNCLGIEQVCRRWRDAAASPAAAPSFKLIHVEATEDAVVMAKIACWFAVHGARVLGLSVFVSGADSRQVWTSTLPVLALAPAPRSMHLMHDNTPPPTGATCGHATWASLTELTLDDFEGSGLERSHRRGGLPPSLAYVKISHARLNALPQALSDSTLLTRLRVFECDVHEAPPVAYWQVLSRLATRCTGSFDASASPSAF